MGGCLEMRMQVETGEHGAAAQPPLTPPSASATVVTTGVPPVSAPSSEGCRQQSGEPMALSAFRTDSLPPRLVMDDLLAELRRTSRIVGARDGVWRLVDAFVGLASAELTLASVLDRIVEVARTMVDAECAALGVIADGGGLREFLHVGMDAAAVERVGGLPEGHGVLGLLVGEPRCCCSRICRSIRRRSVLRLIVRR